MARLPSGTVTFLFTDIEGSTRLLRELGEAYEAKLARHRRVLREAFGAHGGLEVDTQGDAFLYVFADAAAAVRAAEAAQSSLASGPVRVRMGLHTGEPRLTAEGYVGLDVHMGARVAACAHGGQVVLSRETRLRLRDDVPLVDLGEHRVKDFPEPVWLYQLGSAVFPPLRTLSNTNLPTPASSFVGRERERAEVASLLQDGPRVVTLSGPGGSGKTRLALEAAAEVVPEFRNGVFWIPLAALRDPLLVTETIAQTLGAKEELGEYLAGRELLLLLDNFEQVVEAAAALSDLVRRCPGLRLLVTSRERLRIDGEHEYPVLPLAEHDAVALFCARSGVGADEQVGRLCRRLDSLPLAVELAAARTAVLSPAQIEARLSQRLDLLAGGRDADPRQRTLRTTIAWSYDLLDPQEQRLFARLAVFAGGCTLEAAEAVAAAELDALQSLVEKSLVRRSGERFWMLETIREFALERFEKGEDAERVRGAHAQHVLALAEAGNARLRGPEMAEALARLAVEQDNFRAALAWTLAAPPASEQSHLGVKLTRALARFWLLQNDAPESGRWLERALAAEPGEAAVRAELLEWLADFTGRCGDRSRAVALLEEAIALRRESCDQAGLASALVGLAMTARELGDSPKARACLEESLELARQLGHRQGIASGTCWLGLVALDERDYEQAEPLIQESLALAQSDGDGIYVASSQSLLAALAYERGDLAHVPGPLTDALRYFAENNFLDLVAHCLEHTAAYAAGRGDTSQALRFAGAADAIRSTIASVLVGPDRDRLERHLARAERALGQDERAAAYQAGSELTAEEAVSEALELLGAAAGSSAR